jgi:hypothetical protein
MGIFKKKKARKAKGLVKFKKAWKQYKAQGGDLSKSEFKDFYMNKLFGSNDGLANSVEDVLDSVIGSGSGVLDDVMNMFGVGNSDDDHDLTSEDIDEDDKLDISPTGNIIEELPIPNYILYSVLGFLLAKQLKIIK